MSGRPRFQSWKEKYRFLCGQIENQTNHMNTLLSSFHMNSLTLWIWLSDSKVYIVRVTSDVNSRLVNHFSAFRLPSSAHNQAGTPCWECRKSTPRRSCFSDIISGNIGEHTGWKTCTDLLSMFMFSVAAPIYIMFHVISIQEPVCWNKMHTTFYRFEVKEIGRTDPNKETVKMYH